MGNQQERLEVDLHWFGGVFDGDGNISLLRTPGKRKGIHNITPHVRFTNTSRLMIEEVKRIFSINDVPFHMVNGLVLDPFVGSGTTGIAAALEGSSLYRHRARGGVRQHCTSAYRVLGGKRGRMSRFAILVGDVREQLKRLPDESVHCVVTSPPYYGLRDYGVEGQLGNESSSEEYVSNMVEAFREVRRVLRNDGTMWLNIGDSYASSWPAPKNRRNIVGQPMSGGKRSALRESRLIGDLKEKDLIGIPWKLAFALRADGWYLRSDIIWHKPNPMPEPVTDRPTKAHEYIFLLTKSSKYYYDHEAVKEPAVSKHPSGNGSKREQRLSLGGRGSDSEWTPTEKRNRRTVWTVNTRPFKGAHFATFPPDLIEPCILAGSPVDGVVLDPFGGSGTTALVANKHGRRAILIELNPEYAKMARERVKAGAAMRGDPGIAPKAPEAWAFKNGESHTQQEDALLAKIDGERKLSQLVEHKSDCAWCPKKNANTSVVRGQLVCDGCRRAARTVLPTAEGRAAEQKRGGPYWVTLPGDNVRRYVDAPSRRDAAQIVCRELDRRKLPKGTTICPVS